NQPLLQSIQTLKGVNSARQEQLRRLEIETVGDLLFHFPRTYEDLTDIRTVDALVEGTVQTVQGELVEIEGRELADGRTVVSMVLHDGKQCLEGVWFNQPYVSNRYHMGQRLAFSGKPRWYRDRWQMGNPRIQVLDGSAPPTAPGIVPVYPMTEDLRPD